MEEVVLDTNILVAAIVFPQSMGREIIKLAEQKHFLLVLPAYIRRETREVIARDFPAFQGRVSRYLAVAKKTTPLPSATNIEPCLTYLTDEKDVFVLASVLEAKPDYFVTADIEHLHTEKIKAFLKSRSIQVKTPYGFLKAYGKR